MSSENDEDSRQRRSEPSPALSSTRKLLIISASPTPLLEPKMDRNRRSSLSSHKRHRSPSSVPLMTTTTMARSYHRTPSASSSIINASACFGADEQEDEQEHDVVVDSSRCFCPIPPVCMNLLEDAAKAIRRTMGNNKEGGGERDVVRTAEQQLVGCAAATAKKLSTIARGGDDAGRKENLPPNVVQLLTASECELLSSGAENGYTETAEPQSQPRRDDPKQQREARTVVAAGQPLFRPSRFSNVQPTIRFIGSGEKGKLEKPPKSVRRMLKWCYNSLVPKVVRKVLYASSFQIVSEDSYWVGYWGRHLRTQDFHNILPYQKVNHFPGTFHLGRKDRLWINIRRMMTKWPGDRFANVMPRTFVLPKDAKALKLFIKRGGQKTPIILKPPASARGTGVRVIHRWSQIPRKEQLIAQLYVDRPLLISGSKFDLRLYVYVTSFNPLRIYLYENGLVRFASVKYSTSLTTLGNRLMHLTNYSLNKNAIVQEDNRSVTGPKWTVKQLWQYFSDNGYNVHNIMEKVIDIILQAFISCEGNVNSFIRRHLAYPFACHELFGVDIVLDEDVNPWLLEVNISPSLHTSTDLDTEVKSGLVMDVLNLAGVQLPDRQQVHNASPRLPSDLSQPISANCLDLRSKQNDNFLTDDETKKQAFYVRKFLETSKTDPSILDHLTPADVRVLTETEDEYDRRGHFARIFPSLLSSQYLKYFEKPKYYNLLLDEWLGQYYHIRETGCSLLESFCSKGYNLT